MRACDGAYGEMLQDDLDRTGYLRLWDCGAEGPLLQGVASKGWPFHLPTFRAHAPQRQEPAMGRSGHVGLPTGTSSVGREMEDEVRDESFAGAAGAPQTGVRPPVPVD